MISPKNIFGNVKEIFGVKKKNGFSKPWKSEVDCYEGTRKKTSFSFIPHHLLERLPFPRKGKSFISRSEKRKKYGLKLLKISCTIIVALLLIIGAQKPLMQYASSLEFFHIKDIGIYGCVLTKVVEIKEIAEFDYNTSLITLQPRKAEQKLLDNPWIKSAMVKRVWPDGIHIEINEQRAAALLVTGETNKEKMVYVNAGGEIIASVKVGEEIDYPVITGLNSSAEEERESALAEAAAFLKLVAKNNPNLPTQSVSEIHFDHVEGMVIRLVDFPFPIYFGRGEVKKKYKQLRNVLAVLYKQQKKDIDIGKVEYIRMDYLNNKVLVAQSKSG